MKRTLLLAGLAMTLITGCVVTSVYPYYTPKDVTFDPTLIGVWVNADKSGDDDATWTFGSNAPQTYKLVIADKDKKSEFDVRLFKLGGQLFMDCLPRERHDYSIPAHILLRVSSIQPTLQMQPLNHKWLEEWVEENPKAIRHIVIPKSDDKQSNDMDLVLTANTAELQKFILKHLKTKEAWHDPMVMKRQ